MPLAIEVEDTSSYRGRKLKLSSHFKKENDRRLARPLSRLYDRNLCFLLCFIALVLVQFANCSMLAGDSKCASKRGVMRSIWSPRTDPRFTIYRNLSKTFFHSTLTEPKPQSQKVELHSHLSLWLEPRFSIFWIESIVEMDYPKQNAIHFPAKFTPGTTDNFVTNEVIVKGQTSIRSAKSLKPQSIFWTPNSGALNPKSPNFFFLKFIHQDWTPSHWLSIVVFKFRGYLRTG